MRDIHDITVPGSLLSAAQAHEYMGTSRYFVGVLQGDFACTISAANCPTVKSICLYTRTRVSPNY